MAMLTPSDMIPFTTYAEGIPEDALASDGRESEFHITALYGLLENDPEGVIDKCRGFGVITATLGKVESFENDEQDVLKITVDSDDLQRLNKKLRELPYESDYPDYQPHLTLAYLKPGTAKKYVGDDFFDGVVATFDRVTFSDADHKKTIVSLL